MEKKVNKSLKKQQLENNLSTFLDDYYFDVQSISSATPVDEAQLVKLFTKFAVSAATLWWTFMEIKDYMKLKKVDSQIKDSLNDILSGKDSSFNNPY
jgi:hypothetical protein